MTKNTLRNAAVAAALVAFLTEPFADDSFPSRPIRIIVNASPGALLDVTTRAVALSMSKVLNQSVIVENDAGASGLLGIRAVKNAEPNGYTLLATANTVAQLPALKLNPGYDLAKDFVGVGIMDRAPLIMVGSPQQPAKNLPDLIAQAKAGPDTMSFSSGGVGTTTHLAAAMFLRQAGVKLQHIPYKGNAAAMPDLLGGRINIEFDGANSSGPLVRDGKLIAFGVTSTARMPAYPNIPTLAEQGLPNYSFYVYLGLLAPSGTPRDAVRKIAQALKYSLGTDAIRDRMRIDGAEAGSMSPEEFTEFLKSDMARISKVVADLGIPKE